MKDNEELRGALNAGHKRGGQHLRCEGDSNVVKAYKTFAPVALAGIRTLSGTLASRSIVIQLKRAKKGETKSQFDCRHVEHERELNRKLVRWAEDNFEQIKTIEPDLPPDLFNRLADNWRPLFTIAECIGGAWPERLKKAFVLLTNNEEVEDTAGVMLLEDIQRVFASNNTDRISSTDIVDELSMMEERPWPEWGNAGKPVTTRQIARLLKPFGIKPETHRIDLEPKKGYLLNDFKDVFDRYLAIRSVTPLQSNENNDLDSIRSVTKIEYVTDENTQKPALSKGCYRDTDQNPDLKGGEEHTLDDRIETVI